MNEIDSLTRSVDAIEALRDLLEEVLDLFEDDGNGGRVVRNPVPKYQVRHWRKALINGVYVPLAKGSADA